MQNHEQKQKLKNQDCIGKTNFFFGILPLALRTILATWLHIGAPKKYRKKRFTTYFEQKFSMNSYGVEI